MKLSRKTLGIFFLVVFGLAVVFLLRFHGLPWNRVANSWDAWIDEKTEIWTEMEVAAHKEAIPFDPIDESELADIRARNRRKLEDFAAEKLAKYATPAEMKAHGEGIRLDSVTVTVRRAGRIYWRSDGFRLDGSV